MNYYQQAIRTIQEYPVKSVYLLFGEEQLLADDIIQRIKQKFLDKPDPELNLFVRYASEVGVDEIISLGAGMGLFADRKLIVLKDAELLKQKDIEKLVPFIQKNLTDICLILQTGISSLFQSRLKKIENMVYPVNLMPLRENELHQFVKNEFQKLNKEITREAIETLLFRVGSQLSDILVQINHLALFFDDDKTIDVPAVEQITSFYVTQDVFELSRLIGHQEYGKAAVIMRYLLESGVTPQTVLNQLIRYFTLLWKAQGLMRAGVNRAETLASELKVYPKYVGEYQTQGKLWKASHLHQVFTDLIKADRELKNNGLEPQIVLDMLCFKIINLK